MNKPTQEQIINRTWFKQVGQFFISEKPDWLWLIGIFILFRFIYTVFGAVIAWKGAPVSAWVGDPIYETISITVPDWGRIGQLLIDPWFRWDTGWYLKIAALGYSAGDGSIAFAPLYPWLIRLVGNLTANNYLLAALIISNISCVIMLVLLYILAKKELGNRKTAKQAVIYLLVFPTAFYLFAGYTESLFLSLVLGSWLMVVKKNWVWAGILGSLAVLSRFQGWVLLLVFAWYIFVPEHEQYTSSRNELQRFVRRLFSRQGWQEFGVQLRKAWFALLMPVGVIIAYVAWLQMRGLGQVNEAFAKYWDLNFVMPWRGIILIVERFEQGNLLLMDWIDLGLFVFVVFLAVVGTLRCRIPYSLYVWATICIILTRDLSAHLLVSYMRYLLALFPIFLVLAQFASRSSFSNRTINLVYVSISICLQFLLLWAFLNWFWVA